MDNIIDNVPIYVRIAEGIKDHILMGDLKEGEQVISTTQLSKEYNISIATVNKGINMLVLEGVLFKKRGIGMFVAEGAVERLIRERRAVFKEQYVEKLLVEAKRLRYSVDELQQIVREVYEEQQ
ncbi:MAG: GntR family transcriptional regulator [Lachnospiraceae bacterium]|nr:GntR family transcriptional regulator [Lachnospiraceae bacterium]